MAETKTAASTTAVTEAGEPKKKKKKKKDTIPPLEKLASQQADAMAEFFSEYSRRHKKSKDKNKTDQWAWDYPKNVVKAAEKASKKIKLGKIFF